jgi:F-type H+-transporting ATPase subunit a
MLAWINFITRLLNGWFGAPIDALIVKLGIHPLRPGHPVSNAFTLEIIVFAVLTLFFLLVRVTLSVEKPGQAQHIAEMIHEFVTGQAEQVMGHGFEKFLPVVTCLGLFIACLNCFGLLPGIETPTSDPVVPLGLALFTFVYYHFHGLRVHGPVGYLKHFMGPVWWLAPLMFPIEIISHCARVLSLTVRLYANMLASDLITLIFFSMVPLALPLIGLGLHSFVALIQTYIFMLLSMIYLALATEHAEQH